MHGEKILFFPKMHKRCTKKIVLRVRPAFVTFVSHTNTSFIRARCAFCAYLCICPKSHFGTTTKNRVPFCASSRPVGTTLPTFRHTSSNRQQARSISNRQGFRWRRAHMYLSGGSHPYLGGCAMGFLMRASQLGSDAIKTSFGTATVDCEVSHRTMRE